MRSTRQEGDPSTFCIDCSYGFDDVYSEIDQLKGKVLEAYFVGAVGALTCPNCDYQDAGIVNPEVGMSDACRECHYVVEDFLNVDYRDCLHHGSESLKCLSVGRGLYNFDRDVYGVINAAAQAAAAAAAQAAAEAAQDEAQQAG